MTIFDNLLTFSIIPEDGSSVLYYAGTGWRDYHGKPIPCRKRAHWEFQAVLAGKIAMTRPAKSSPLHARRLWLSAPGHAHGWTGSASAPAQVLVFHFLTIPEMLARQIPPRGCMELALSKSQTARLRELSQIDWRRISPDALLRSEHVLLELSLLALDSLKVTKTDVGQIGEIPALRVRQALDWFGARMEFNPGLEEVSRAVGCSASQLRKHFYAIMHRGPKAVFDQLRFQRALQLLADPGTKLSWIGETCGFGEPSVFSRAFKAKLGVSPARWRGTKT